MMRVFDWPWMAVASLLGAVAMGALVLTAFRRRLARLTRMGARELVLRLVPLAAVARPTWRAWRLGAAALFATLALAGPRWGQEQSVVRGEGIDVVLALDASLSMLATDERPNRLERMKQEVRRFRASGRGDRIAVLAFAGRSYILTPLTVDDGALELFLENLDPSIVGQAGSSLARAITQGTDLLQATKTAGDRAIVLMSDGEAFEDEKDVVEAATRAADAGIALVTVGFGTPEGANIPIQEGSQVVFKRDEDNNIVVTRYHPEFLDAAARAAHGTFIAASETDKASKIRAALQTLRSVGRSVDSGRTETPRYQLFLLPALLLVLLDLWRVERRGRRRVAPAAAMAASLLLVAHGCALPRNYASRAAAEYHSGRYAEAAATYRRALREGDRRPAMMYNFGTALVAADSNALAAEPLERASKAEDAELRFRAFFNLGLAHLKRGLAGANGADSTKEELDVTLEAYKRALLMRPADADAKWNYELALRKKQEGGGGGGGGDAQSQSGGASSPEQSQNERPSGGLGQQQAEQLLNSAAREERGVQGRKQRQSKPNTPPGGKDW
jgi:Ca-activated chloride channel family protein